MNRWSAVLVVASSMAAACGDDGTAGPGAGAGGGAGTAGLDAAAGGAGGAAGTGMTGSSDAAVGGSGGMATGGVPGPNADAGMGSGGMTGSLDAAPTDMAPAAVAMMIPAAAGGTLTAGGASLLVPAGVLGTDQTLTVSVHAPTASDPGSSSIVGNIYEFGPTGTTFSVPVALTLPLPGPIPADKKAVVAWLETSSGQWFPIPTTIGETSATGLVSHFTRFALLHIPKDDICPYAGACGGSLEGTWKYSQSCLAGQESVAFECGDAGSVPLRQQYSVGGTVTIADGRYTATQMLQVTATLFYTPACMAVLRDLMPGATCATLQEAWRMETASPGNPSLNWICAGTPEQGCSCQATNGASQTIMGGVTTSGQQVTFTQDGKQPSMPDDFCVQGNNLSVRTSSGDVYTAIKQ